MKIAIFGYRDGVYVHEQIGMDKESKYYVEYFCDNNIALHGSSTYDIPVISADMLYPKIQTGEIDAVMVAVRNGYNRWSITDQLISHGIEKKKIAWVKPSALTYRWPIFSDNNEEQILWLGNCTKPLIPYVEVHVCDVCNLNCKGCLHFSNLFTKEKRFIQQQLMCDVSRLNEVCDIFHLRILGGEPLLNENLADIIQNVRQILPNTDIAIVTNGTLITRQREELFRIMKKNGVGFNITLYPPTYDKKEEIYKVLKENDVSYGSHRPRADEFFKGFLIHPQDKTTCSSYLSCVSKGCLFLREGRLYKCAPEALIYKFYERFPEALFEGRRWDEEKHGVDIYNDEIEWDKLIYNMYSRPVEQCLYCSNNLVKYNWGVSNPPHIEDWIVDMK